MSTISFELTKTSDVTSEQPDYAAILISKILSRTAKVGVVGLGYVGLPLAVEFAKAGFSVTGIDVHERKVGQINDGQSYVQDVPSDDVASLVASGKLRATTDFSAVADLDTINIAVPTPLRKTKDPDMSFVLSACQEVARYFGPGKLVILESTTYPGNTDELVMPLMAQSGLQVGTDFFLCFSPERVDPGNPQFNTANIPKVVGGVTSRCVEAGVALYSQIINSIVPVSSTRAAETVKLLENTFRMINIGLANEMAMMCSQMGINVWEVIDAAATKPFGFMPFYPGPGLGGHCIPIDPFYLSWKSKQAGGEARFIELAGQVNGQMPHFVANKVQDALNGFRKPVSGSHIHILGVAYKRDIDDVRESPALDIIHLLEAKGAVVTYSDPYVPKLRIGDRELLSADIDTCAATADCAVIITDHTSFDYSRIIDLFPLIVDSRNALKKYSSKRIVRL